jgi:hypothetical protein
VDGWQSLQTVKGQIAVSYIPDTQVSAVTNTPATVSSKNKKLKGQKTRWGTVKKTPNIQNSQNWICKFVITVNNQINRDQIRSQQLFIVTETLTCDNIHISNLLYQGKYYRYTVVTSAIWMTKSKSFTYPKDRPCLSSGRKSPSSHSGGPGWSPGQAIWDLWCAKCHWGRFSPSTYISSAIFIPPTHHLSSGSGKIGQLVADVPSGLSLIPHEETKKKTLKMLNVRSTRDPTNVQSVIQPIPFSFWHIAVKCLDSCGNSQLQFINIQW